MKEARRRSSGQVFTVFHAFAGHLRDGNIEYHIPALAEHLPDAYCITMYSADLDRSASWDLSVPQVFAEIQGLIGDGLVDIWIGGPPCSTWSRAHWSGGPGPRTLHVRGQYGWGLPGLYRWEYARLAEASTLFCIRCLWLGRSASVAVGT